MQNTVTDYLTKISQSLKFIRIHYIDQLSQDDQTTFLRFERVYNYIDSSFKNGYINEAQVFSVYGYFLKTVKKFKRQIENKVYSKSTDYDSCRQKLQRLNVKLIPLFTELELSQIPADRVNQDILIDANMPHHIFTRPEICSFYLKIFDYLKLDSIQVPKAQLEQLIQEVCLNYNVVAYHNFTHAFQLSQLLFSCYMKSELKNYSTQLEIFSAILAGMSHDLNHKGVNNLYKVKKSKKYNILTTETAVLENMHAATFFNIIQLNRDLDIFKHFLNDEERNISKRVIITCILATDMSKHFKLLSKFTRRVESTLLYDNNQKDELIEFQRFTKEKSEDRLLILNYMTHACDISNPCMNFKNYMNWAYLLAQEFQDQTIKEADGGLEITGFLQFKDRNGFYGGQIGFSKNMVLPLWQPIGKLFPELKYLPDEIEKNIEIIQQKLKQ